MENNSEFISVREHLSDSFEIYKKGLGVYVALMAIPVIISFLITSMFNQGFFVAGTILIPLVLIINLIATSSLYYAVVHNAKNVTFSDSIKSGLKLAIPFFWISFIKSFLTSGALIFFVIPGLIFSIWFYFSSYALFTDEARGMNALLLSRDYIKGFVRKVVFRFLIIGILMALVWVPIALLSRYFESGIIGVLTSTAYTIFITPFAIVYGLVMYKDIKRIKGEISKEFSAKRKLKYIVLSLLGYILILALVLFVFKTAYKAFRQNEQLIKDSETIVFDNNDDDDTSFTDGPLSQAREVKRKSELLSILSAVYLYSAENGSFPPDFPTESTCIGQSPDCYDLYSHLVPDYLPITAADPKIGDAENSQYNIWIDSGGRINVTAKGELEETIAITR